MISLLIGDVAFLDAEAVTLLCGGVGYELSCSLNTLSELQGKSSVTLHVYTHVREDQLQLYGFLSRDEKHFFLNLLKVNKIGPKVALNILSGASLKQLMTWLEDGNVGALSKLPRVGKKTAEQMVLSLKGKLVLSANEILGPRSEMLSALLNLGYKSSDAEKALAKLPLDIDLHEGVRQALQMLSRRET